MTAILFGSIGSLADTSEMQRAAFNEAFTRHGLDWNWSQDEYRELLRDSGGERRIAAYARARGEDVDAAAVHATKSEIFQQRLRSDGATPRPGVTETIEAAGRDGTAVALVTTTSPENISALTEALAPAVDIGGFALVTDTSDVSVSKPAAEAYVVALQKLGESPQTVVAVEDNVGGSESAAAAGVTVVAFPSENNAGQEFPAARTRVEALAYDDLRGLAGDAA